MTQTVMDVAAINIPYPVASEYHLLLRIGACHLNIHPGEGDAWVAGSYHDGSNSLPYRLAQDGGLVTITQEFKATADMVGLFSHVPRFDLRLGKTKPYALTIEAGATDSAFDLGGLPITRLVVKHGASRYAIDFSAPNPETMTLLNIGAGAGALQMTNLANANFTTMRVEGGAAAHRFGFGGTLRQNATVRIATGVASVELFVPATTAAQITSESVFGNLDIGDGFMKKEGAFWNEAALEGKTPLLTIQANVALGSLKMRST